MFGSFGEGGDGVDFGQFVCQIMQLFCFGIDGFDDFGKEVCFEFVQMFFCFEDLCFEFF